MICSVTPMEKFPRPSNCFGLIPRKSRVRGMAMDTKRSRNSYIRSCRRVTLHPMGQPSRILKPAIDLRALRSEEHTSELQSRGHLVCRLLLEKKKIYTATATLKCESQCSN